MIYQSRSISLQYMKYSESSIIVKILTEKNGVQNFIIKGVRKRKSKNKLSLFESLTLLEITANYRPKNNLQQLKEVSLAEPGNTNIQNKLLKIFIAEVLSKCLLEGKEDPDLFHFIWQLTIKINLLQDIDKNLPLIFLINLAEKLGFSPDYNELSIIENNSPENLKILLRNRKSELSKEKRKQILNYLFDYYKLHEHELLNMKSHIIIESLH